MGSDKSRSQSVSHVSGPTDRPLIEKTVGDFFDEIAMRHTDCEALSPGIRVFA